MTTTNTWNYRTDLSQDIGNNVVGYNVEATDGEHRQDRRSFGRREPPLPGRRYWLLDLRQEAPHPPPGFS